MKTRIHMLLAFFVFLSVLTSVGSAATLYVGGGGYSTIQAAIDGASDFDEIEVAPGTYPEAIDFNGKAVRLYSSGGQDVTVIDATGLSSSVVTCTGGEGSNTVLEGFTLTGGSAVNGGGMYNNGSSPTVTGCTFTGNSAGYSGGGMYNQSSSPTVTGCTFSENTSHGGGGMHNEFSSSPTVTGCTFSGNNAYIYGGGMFNSSSSDPTVTNCTFSGNTVLLPFGIGGGGMCNLQSAPTVTNCTFSGNTASIGFGGGMYNSSSDPEVINCTFSGNTAANWGGGMYNISSATTVTNCTFIGNTAGTGGGMYNNEGVYLENLILWGNTPDQLDGGGFIWNSDIQGGVPAGLSDEWGNIDSDPLFVDADGPDNTPGTTDDNFRLSVGSPCIDAGYNVFVTEPNDLDGLTRIIDGDCYGTATVDMGAHEFDWLYLGDFAGGCDVNLTDFAVMAQSWQQDNRAIDIVPYLAPDGIIDLAELLVVVNHWLEGTQ